MVFDIGSSMGLNFTLLDIGGGFPGSDSAQIPFHEVKWTLSKILNLPINLHILLFDSCKINYDIVFQICDALSPALDQFFPLESGVRVIAEPGTYFVQSAFTIAVNVIAKRRKAQENKKGQ